MRNDDPKHPRRTLLLKFLQARTTRTESWAVVRHLLAGCPECGRVTGRILWLSELPPPVLDPLESENLGSDHGDTI
jgi:hypothetical protein